MKINVKKEELEKAITFVSRTVSQNASEPLLMGIKLEIRESYMKFSSYDYSQSSEYIMNVKTGQKDDLLFYGIHAVDIVRQLSDENIELKKEDNHLIFSSGTQTYTAALMPLNEYPELPQPSESVGSILADSLIKGVNQVGFAAYKDETLPTLTGVNISFKDKNNISLTSTDKSRLAIKILTYNTENGGGKASAIVKASFLSEMLKSFEGDNDIKIHIKKEKPDIIAFSTKTKVTTALLIDSDYPDVESVIPKNNEIIAEFPKVDLLNAAKGISTVAGKDGILHLSLQKGNAVLKTESVSDESSGSETLVQKESVTVKYDSDKEFNIYFIPSYFKEGIDAVSTDNILIKLNNEKTPVAFYEKDSKTGENKEFVYVLVPFIK